MCTEQSGPRPNYCRNAKVNSELPAAGWRVKTAVFADNGRRRRLPALNGQSSHIAVSGHSQRSRLYVHVLSARSYLSGTFRRSSSKMFSRK
jgi:hypothetical protein